MFISARRNFSGGGEARFTQGGLVRGWPSGGFRGLSPRTPEKFSKICKKSNEKFTIFEKIFKKISRFFQIFFNILSNFWRKFG